jgi:hypothetical protein
MDNSSPQAATIVPNRYARTLGVDIGNAGAIAILEAGEIVSVHDMPTLADGPARRRSINAPLLASLIREANAAKAYVEFVGPRPKEGAVGAFAFGRSRGVVEGVLAAHGLPIEFVTPAAWKRAVGIPPGEAKDLARSEAIRRWPAQAHLFARKCDDGRAEAALIGCGPQGVGPMTPSAADAVEQLRFDALGEIADMASGYANELADAATRGDRQRARLFACQLSRVTRTALLTIAEIFAEREREPA